MQMKSMKLSPADKKAEEKSMEVSSDSQEYPWGLTLRLEQDTMDKLSTGELKVGDELMMQAAVRVTSVSSHDGEGGSESSASLQITEMGLDAGSTNKEKADKLFPSTKS